MKKPHLWKNPLSALHLADKCLLVFMAILLLQSAYNLFFYTRETSGSSALNIIIRTTAAAIFGYFISANFQNGGDIPENDNKDLNMKAQEAEETCTNQMGCRNHLQILVVAGIGIFALLVLVIAHDSIVSTHAVVATTSQLRDFVSGSVGFLIGHSTHQKKIE